MQKIAFGTSVLMKSSSGEELAEGIHFSLYLRLLLWCSYIQVHLVIVYVFLHLSCNYTVPRKPKGLSKVIMVQLGAARACSWYVTFLVPGASTWS